MVPEPTKTGKTTDAARVPAAYSRTPAALHTHATTAIATMNPM
jgi:hypothetical protein